MKHGVVLASDDALELIWENYRLGFCVGEEPSWFVVTPDGKSDSGNLVDANLCKAIRSVIRQHWEEK